MAMLFLSNAKKEYFAYRLLSMCVEKKIGYAHTCVTLLHMRITDQRSRICVWWSQRVQHPLLPIRERGEIHPNMYILMMQVLESLVQKMGFGIWPYVQGKVIVGGHKISQECSFWVTKNNCLNESIICNISIV